MSKVLVKPPEVGIKEEQSLAQAQELVLSVFSSVAYIRDLFSEDSYKDAKIAGMQTKRLKKGSNLQATRFLEWIEKGCFDALKKKYLETVVLGVFTDPSNPTNMLETYTLTMEYPSSPAHQQLAASYDHSVSMQLSVKKNGRQENLLGGNMFQKEIVGLLRSLCVLVQTLEPLPDKRYLTMQITYYDELTPRDYEPPGFVPQDFDINYIFQEPTLKHTFSSATSNHHNGNEKQEQQEAKSDAVVPASIDIKPPRIEPTPNIAFESQPSLIKSMEAVVLKQPVDTLIVRCACEDGESDLDMIQCDGCGCWQHTPCAGYCSNRDKRIPKDNYICYSCRFGSSKKTMGYLKELACFRRVTAILFTDGFQSYTDLAKRLGCPLKKASLLVKRLEDEGLLERKPAAGGKISFSACSGAAVKERLNRYFGPDPTTFPDFPEPAKRRTEKEIDPVVPKRRRKSESSLKIDA